MSKRTERPQGVTQRKRMPDLSNSMKLQLLDIYVTKAVDPLVRSKKVKILVSKARGKRARAAERSQIKQLIEKESEGIYLLNDDGEHCLMNLYTYDNMATVLVSNGLSSQEEGQGLLYFVDAHMANFPPELVTPQLVHQEAEAISALARDSLRSKKEVCNTFHTSIVLQFTFPQKLPNPPLLYYSNCYFQAKIQQHESNDSEESLKLELSDTSEERDTKVDTKFPKILFLKYITLFAISRPRLISEPSSPKKPRCPPLVSTSCTLQTQQLEMLPEEGQEPRPGPS